MPRAALAEPGPAAPAPRPQQRIGVLVCGHGSRNRAASAEFARLAERLAGEFAGWPVEYGYLEFARPTLSEALDRLRERGLARVLALPGMLFAAGHAKNDIPSVLNAYQARHPGLAITYGRDLGIDPLMLRAAADRVREGLAGGRPGVALDRTLLLVVGRGASDPDANSNVAKVTRLLWEGLGLGWAETAYSGVTFPLVEPALEHAARLGYARIVVFPYFLFTGVLVARIYAAADAVAARHPGIEFLKAPYLNAHDAVVATFVDRAREILVGQNLMNCQMCKYRAQVLGFEAEVGAPQQSHHGHVEGVGAACDLCNPDGTCNGRCQAETHTHADGTRHAHGHHHGHDHHHHHDGKGGHHHHGHGHGHAHHHHPYPHADHPLGPRSLKRG